MRHARKSCLKLPPWWGRFQSANARLRAQVLDRSLTVAAPMWRTHSCRRPELAHFLDPVGRTIGLCGLSFPAQVWHDDRRQEPIVCPTVPLRERRKPRPRSKATPTQHAGLRAPRKPPLIIGYGNSLRGDDAVGPCLATTLGGLAVQQLVPELAECLASEERVVFIDARTDLAPGDVQIMPVDGDSASSHWCSPVWLLRLALEVYGKAPEAVLVGIGAQSFDLGAPLSPAARAGMEKALAKIRALR